MPTITIDLPKAYPLQREIIDHSAKRKVISAGRRAGKTHLSALAAVEAFFGGERVLLSSTSQEQADVFWRYITRWLRPLTSTEHIYKNESRRILRLGDAEIRVKTGRDEDALRGDGVSLLVLDECARLKPQAWQEVGAPMLADTNGRAYFISTPLRRNWFFTLYQRGIDNADPDNDQWASWNFASTANPHLQPEALDALARDMTEEGYQQEILAQFLESSGAVFRHVHERSTGEPRTPYEGRFVFGVDWAQQQDFTVITIIDSDSHEVVGYERFKQQDYTIQRERVKTLFQQWKPHTVVSENNSIGVVNNELLAADGLPIWAFETTGVSKPKLIESLVLAFDRAEITSLNDPVLMGELMAYERKVTATGRSQYSAPDGMHDDMVMSLALAWYGVMNAFEVYTF